MGGDENGLRFQGKKSINSLVVERLRSAGYLDRLFINGHWVMPQGRDLTSAIDPSTEQSVAEIALRSAEDVAVAVAAARRAFLACSVSTAQSMALLLDRIHSLILERAEWFAQAISFEMGAAIGFARSTQGPVAAEHVRVARDNLASYPFLQQRMDVTIMREAIGVCGLITP